MGRTEYQQKVGNTKERKEGRDDMALNIATNFSYQQITGDDGCEGLFIHGGKQVHAKSLSKHASQTSNRVLPETYHGIIAFTRYVPNQPETRRVAIDDVVVSMCREAKQGWWWRVKMWILERVLLPRMEMLKLTRRVLQSVVSLAYGGRMEKEFRGYVEVAFKGSGSGENWGSEIVLEFRAVASCITQMRV